MTWTKCDKCGYVGSRASVNVTYNADTGKHEATTPEWKCPRCSRSSTPTARSEE